MITRIKRLFGYGPYGYEPRKPIRLYNESDHVIPMAVTIVLLAILSLVALSIWFGPFGFLAWLLIVAYGISR